MRINIQSRSGKAKSGELGSVRGEGAMATASQHVRKLLAGLTEQVKDAPLTHKVCQTDIK